MLADSWTLCTDTWVVS